MDESSLRAAQDDLVAWGLLEVDEEGPRLTRRLRGALARAAAELQVQEAAGQRPPGHAVENALERALDDHELPDGAELTRIHRRLLVAVEVASLPEAVRRFLET